MKKNNFTKVLANIAKVEKRISNGVYDFLVNPVTDAEFSIVHIVNTLTDVDYDLDGWHLWIAKKEYENEPKSSPVFLQLVNNQFGFDHHVLTDFEISSFFEFFLGEGYSINRIK